MEIKYSTDEDILMVELSDENILYAEKYGPLIIHYSKNDRPVLLEFLEWNFSCRSKKII